VGLGRQASFSARKYFHFFRDSPVPPRYDPGHVQTRHLSGTLSWRDRDRASSRVIAGHPQWHRRRISEELARLWDWRSPSGQLKDMAARTLLLKHHGRGWITLPPRRRQPVNRMAGRRPVEADLFSDAVMGERCHGLPELLPLCIEEISRKKQAGRQAVFSGLLERHHYLSHRGTVGENMQYLVSDRQGDPLACVLFGAAAWQCRARDCHIGWDAATRARGLSYVTNNTRFLIPHFFGGGKGGVRRGRC
jgi:hypothetical protein